MQWIIDLLIDKLKKDKEKEWEPEPLWIEDDYSDYNDDKQEEDDEDGKKVIIIDI